jgi:hypothetical protein
MTRLILASAGAVALLVSVAQSPVAHAQSVTVGPGGLEFDRDNYARRDWERHRRLDDDRTGTIVERREHGPGCRTVTVRKETDDGDVVTRRIRRCG